MNSAMLLPTFCGHLGHFCRAAVWCRRAWWDIWWLLVQGGIYGEWEVVFDELSHVLLLKHPRHNKEISHWLLDHQKLRKRTETRHQSPKRKWRNSSLHRLHQQRHFSQIYQAPLGKLNWRGRFRRFGWWWRGWWRGRLAAESSAVERSVANRRRSSRLTDIANFA